MNVLVTGAFGRVGTAIIDHLADRDRYEFTYLDREPHPEHGGYVADVSDASAIRPAFDDQDAVIHLAGTPHSDAGWSTVLESNIVGTYTVLDAAAEAGVQQVLFASTCQVMLGYLEDRKPNLYDEPISLSVDHTDPPRPTSYYAVSKLFGEHLGRYYVEDDGRIDQCYSVRIGWVPEREWDHPYGPAERMVASGDAEPGDEQYRRSVIACQGLWCSRRDFARFTDCVLPDDTVTYDVFYARSRGSRQWLDIDHARDVLGYEPADDADAYDGPPDFDEQGDTGE